MVVRARSLVEDACELFEGVVEGELLAGVFG
jgi:hypothetical protein